MINTTSSDLHVIVALSKTHRYIRPSLVCAFVYKPHCQRMLKELANPLSPVYDEDDQHWVVIIEPGQSLEEALSLEDLLRPPA